MQKHRNIIQRNNAKRNIGKVGKNYEGAGVTKQHWESNKENMGGERITRNKNKITGEITKKKMKK